MMSITECPACGREHNSSLPVNTKYPPRPNDLSICSACGAISTYGPDMALHIVPDAEVRAPEMAVARSWQDKIRRLKGLPVKGDA